MYKELEWVLRVAGRIAGFGRSYFLIEQNIKEFPQRHVAAIRFSRIKKKKTYREKLFLYQVQKTVHFSHSLAIVSYTLERYIERLLKHTWIHVEVEGPNQINSVWRPFPLSKKPNINKFLRIYLTISLQMSVYKQDNFMLKCSRILRTFRNERTRNEILCVYVCFFSLQIYSISKDSMFCSLENVVVKALNSHWNTLPRYTLPTFIWKHIEIQPQSYTNRLRIHKLTCSLVVHKTFVYRVMVALY